MARKSVLDYRNECCLPEKRTEIFAGNGSLPNKGKRTDGWLGMGNRDKSEQCLSGLEK